jgi:hypothetical protein
MVDICEIASSSLLSGSSNGERTSSPRLIRPAPDIGSFRLDPALTFRVAAAVRTLVSREIGGTLRGRYGGGGSSPTTDSAEVWLR